MRRPEDKPAIDVLDLVHLHVPLDDDDDDSLTDDYDCDDDTTNQYRQLSLLDVGMNASSLAEASSLGFVEDAAGNPVRQDGGL